jgi:formiminoglutamase
MAWHAGHKPLFDGGDVVCDADHLEAAQAELEHRVCSFMKARHLPIVLGGGHEVAYGTGGGVFAANPIATRIGIVNIDAHLDLRVGPARNSGTSFADLATRAVAERREVHYMCIGVAESSNTEALFNRARSHGASWIFDCDVRRSVDDAVKALLSFVDRCDAIYLSIDMDALPSHEAPGVSAPASLGIPFEVVLTLAKSLAQSEKMCAVDIAEVNPRLDIDNRTARLAARLIHTIIHAR